MTKELFYDLDFTDTSIAPMSAKAVAFLARAYAAGLSRASIYQVAIDQGLHVRFETVTVRDSVTAV